MRASIDTTNNPGGFSSTNLNQSMNCSVRFLNKLKVHISFILEHSNTSLIANWLSIDIMCIGHTTTYIFYSCSDKLCFQKYKNSWLMYIQQFHNVIKEERVTNPSHIPYKSLHKSRVENFWKRDSEILPRPPSKHEWQWSFLSQIGSHLHGVPSSLWLGVIWLANESCWVGIFQYFIIFTFSFLFWMESFYFLCDGLLYYRLGHACAP